jgi:tetratricopeptide (TPR) repeat protein
MENLRELFRKVADVPWNDRERILADRRVPADLRAEIESLLLYDSASGESLTRRVSDAAQEALDWGSGPVSRDCGPYRLVRLLGSGGMGAVYLAERRDGEIEQKVAIKLLRADADQPAWRERFLKERQLLAYLSHAAIARLLDAGHTDDGRPYLVMEHVAGAAIDKYATPLALHAQLRLFLLVCDGVSHAHRHLIVHRDLKPSNILVDSSGQPKLLDFGIAKLLDEVTGETRTVERLLTPQYASPEQLRGDVETIATDIYSLGAVLYKLLTGRSPGETPSSGPLKTDLPRDIAYILRKALRHEPEERYASVDAFACDIRAFLESRPVHARSGDFFYRTRKFLRRYRVGAAAATVMTASLLLGVSMANQQRGIAQARLLQVRQLANKVLALDEVAGGLHTSTKATHEIVAMSTEYLEQFIAETDKDQGVAIEAIETYSLLARAHGICMGANRGQRTHAEMSLLKANHFVEPVLHAHPDNRRALLTAARISHDRMILAENDQRSDEAAAEALKAVGYLDRLRDLGKPSASESGAASELFYDIALSHKNLYLVEDGIRYARRSIEYSRSSPNPHLRLSMGLSMLADLLRLSGDLEGALLAIREARANLQNAHFPSDRERRSSWCRVLGREGKILGAGAINLNRPDEAIAVLQRAFDLLEGWAQDDREDAWNRLLFASLGRELGDVLRVRDPQRALGVYDHALYRLRELKDNIDARRGEVEILAGSAYALRRLKRIDEAGNRIEESLRLLGETNDYPVARVGPQTAAYEVLRASGDHLSETGKPQQALKVYEDLLDKVIASKLNVQNDLRHALALSQLYGSLAALYRSNGQSSRGKQLSDVRLELWRHWDAKLPDNGFVRRQFEATHIH